MTIIETDARSRAVIPGHRNERFVMQENTDGSVLLSPARVVTEAQAEYDADSRAARAPGPRRRLADRAPAPLAPHRVSEDDEYSRVADEQLDALAEGPDTDLYDAVLDACELVFRLPARAQSMSTAITTEQGTRPRLPVRRSPPLQGVLVLGRSSYRGGLPAPVTVCGHPSP